MFLGKKCFAAVMALLMMSSFVDINIVQATEVNNASLNVGYFNEQEIKTGGVEKVICEEISEDEMDDIPEYTPKIDDDKSDEDSDEEFENVFGYGAKNDIQYCSTRGRSSLANLENGENMQKAYDMIGQYLHEVQRGEEINPTEKKEKYYLASLMLDSFNLSKQQLKAVFVCIRYDHPELFWLSGSYSVTANKTTNIVKKASFSVVKKYRNSNYIKKEKGEINKALSEYLKAVEGCKSDYEIEQVFHDKIVKETLYDFDDENNREKANINSHSIAGVLIDHVAVCEGYAKTMQILLNAKKIENVFVIGGSINGDHAWNQVKIGGEYYNLDATWDETHEPGGFGVEHNYFNVKDSDFQDHWPNTPNSPYEDKPRDYLYEVEKCDSDEYTWTNMHRDEILSSVDCDDEGIREYIVSQLNKTSEDYLVGLKMCGEDYDTAKKILDYIKYNKDKILEDENLDKHFLEKYEDNFRCQTLVNGNTSFKVTLRKRRSLKTEDISLPDELNIYLSNDPKHLNPEKLPLDNNKYLNPEILPGYATDDIKWSINRPKVAKIDPETGLITPLSTGRAIIIARMGEAMDACVLTVYDLSYYTYKDDLQKLYDESIKKKEEDYIPERWDIFKEALSNAEDVLDDDKVLQSDVDFAMAELKDAVDNLIKKF